MLKHTKKIKEMYEDIQRSIFYMIPEKWEKMYLYASVSDLIDRHTTGEMFFYYIPKGIFKKNPVNVYEIPQKFNLDEKEYMKLVNILYKKIVELREEFKKIEVVSTWTNLTMKIEGVKFNIEYDYEDLSKSKFNSYETEYKTIINLGIFKVLKVTFYEINEESYENSEEEASEKAFDEIDLKFLEEKKYNFEEIITKEIMSISKNEYDYEICIKIKKKVDILEFGVLENIAEIK